jgi:hypothetical protein
VMTASLRVCRPLACDVLLGCDGRRPGLRRSGFAGRRPATRCSGNSGRRPGLRRSGYAGRRPAMRCSGNAVLRALRSGLVSQHGSVRSYRIYSEEPPAEQAEEEPELGIDCVARGMQVVGMSCVARGVPAEDRDCVARSLQAVGTS